MPVSRTSRAAAAVLATTILVPTALIGVSSATADSGTGTATATRQQGPIGHGFPDRERSATYEVALAKLPG